MKKCLLLVILLVFLFATTLLYAGQTCPLGISNIAVKVDYLNFTEDAFENLELEDGIYVGLEGYYSIFPNVYLGVEGGWAGAENDDDIDTDLGEVNVNVDVTFVPIELNLKYAFEFSPGWVMDFGAGGSYSYFEIEADDIDESADDWLFGGQFFVDINYKMSESCFIGINGKYQITEDLEFDNFDSKTSADNWRAGMQLGFMF